MLQILRERLALVLIAALPLHALLVTVLTRLIAGPGRAPLSWLAIWKEGVLAVILGIAVVEILRAKRLRSFVRWDRADVLVLALGLLGIAVSLMLRVPSPAILLGLRYDVVPLLAFVLLRRVPWSASFVSTALRTALWTGLVVVGYGMLAMLLPDGFFTAIGYSDLHSLYLPGRPIAAFQQLGGLGIRRMQSTFSGPNQCGLWLLLPWSMACLLAARRGWASAAAWGLLLIIGIGILLTFSRSAWIASALIAFCTVLFSSSRRRMIGVMVFSGVAAVCLAFLIFHPAILLRAASSRDHLLRPLEASARILRHPLGQGFGAAGPASNRLSDACVFLEPGADARWAQAHGDLCVFVGGTQVQPNDRACRCPFLPENWYLQIAVETGIAGGVLFLALTVLLIVRLRRAAPAVFLAFLGVAVAALFLHAWEDAAIAVSLWLLAAAALPVRSAILTSPSPAGG